MLKPRVNQQRCSPQAIIQQKKTHCAEASPVKGQEDPAQWQEPCYFF